MSFLQEGNIIQSSFSARNRLPERLSRRIAIIGLLTAVLIVSGCAIFPADKPIIDIAGGWDSPEWGSLQLTQEGTAIKGAYCYEDKTGYMEGSLDGRLLRFRWWENVELGQPYNAAAKGSRGDGYFTISEDGRSLKGEWKLEGNPYWNGAWTAQK